MPDHLRRSLLDKIKLIFPESYFKNTDTAAEGIDNAFSAVHFAYYNRYSECVRISFSIFCLCLFLSFYPTG